MPEAPERMTLEQIQDRFDQSPAISTLGLKVLSLDYAAAELKVEMPFRPTLERRPGTGQFHGGPIAFFIDTVGDYAVGMMLGAPVPTINIRIDYLKPAVGGSLTAVARVRVTGRRVSVVDIEVLNDEASLIAIGRGTYASVAG